MSSSTPETGKRPLTNFSVADATPCTRQGLEDSITQVNMHSRPTNCLNPSLEQLPERAFRHFNIEPVIIGKEPYHLICPLVITERNGVFLAQGEESKRKVAIKQFSEVEQFYGEKDTQEILLRSGGHINLLLADEFLDEQLLIISLYARYGNLRQWQKREGNLSLPQAQAIASGVLDALQYMHDCNVIHRDVKSANIVFDDPVLEMPKVVDYEMGRHPRFPKPEEGTVVGTPHYIAPEVWEGKNPDPRSDIYSSGITFYQLLTGRFPFDGTTDLDIMREHLEAPVPDIRKHNPELTEGLKDIFEKALAKNPDERYQTPAELKKDLLEDVRK